MNINTGIGGNPLPEGQLAQMEPSLTDSRPPSVVSSSTHSYNRDYAGELWDELDVLLQAQANDLIEQDEASPTDVPGSLFDTPAAPIVKRPSMPTSPTLACKHQSGIPSLVSGPSLSPSVSLPPMQPIIPELKGECPSHVSPPYPHVLLPSQGASIVGQSAKPSPVRESPPH